MNKFVFCLLLLLQSWSFASAPCTSPLCTGYGPGQGLQPVNEDAFRGIVNEFRVNYSPLFSQWGQTLRIDDQWPAATVFAAAYAQPGTTIATVILMGGLARFPGMTQDGLRFTLCHEIGHHLAGTPLMPPSPFGIMSAEGQADYFAALVCMPQLLRQRQDNLETMGKVALPAVLNARCTRTFGNNALNRAICLRTALAGATLINTISRTASFPLAQFEAHDPTVVAQTIVQGYPSPQCRLDTVVSGANCAVPDIQISSTLKKAVCQTRASNPEGSRPACWFKN